jgi:hypothetical protein
MALGDGTMQRYFSFVICLICVCTSRNQKVHSINIPFLSSDVQ